MKKLLFLSALLLFLSACRNRPFYEQKNLGIKDPVVFVKDTHYNITSPSAEPTQADIVRITYIECDDQGNKVKNITFCPDGRIESSTTYQYDQKGKRIHMFLEENFGEHLTEQSLQSQGKNDETWTTRTIPADNDATPQLIFCQFDPQERTRTSFNMDIPYSETTIEKYDANANLVELTITNDDMGDNLYHILTTYDNQNRETTMRLTQGEHTMKSTFRYDETDTRGNWTKRAMLMDGEVVSFTHREIKYK